MLEQPDPRTRQALDLDRLLGLMAGRTRTAHGREWVRALAPLPADAAARRSALVGEMRLRLEEGSGGCALPSADMRPWIARTGEGGVVRLEMEELRDAGQALEAAEATRLELSSLDSTAYPGLRLLGQELPELEPTAALFHRTFDAQGNIRDDATLDLQRLRKRLERLDGEIQARVEKLLGKLGPYLAEQYVTLRNDRYVFPVRADSHRKVPGLLHGQSGTGATWFVEPFEVVELNNERNEVRLEEQAEVDRILRALTTRLREQLPELRRASELLAEVDFLEALARSSRLWQARAVDRSPAAVLELRGVRHPLLVEQRGGSGSVVPLDLSLDDDRAGTLITGPNMGGKTVVLKTVGLTVYLAASGAHVPAGAGTVVGDFEGLWADIGDAQSLERDLSTFAGHLMRLDQVLAAAGPRALVLCDELGTGTDPAEGAALSRAFLEALRARGARVLATSHLGALKLFAGGDSGYANASMEFEPGTFQPTYRLRSGVPGGSHAIEMAQRLNCLEALLPRARALLDPEERDAQRLLEALGRLTELQQRTLAEGQAAAGRAEQLSAELNRRIGEWEQERLRLRDTTREDLDRKLAEAERWISDMKAAARAKNREAMREARQRLEQRLQEVAPPPTPPSRWHEFQPGERARLPRLSATVEILSAPGSDGRVWVAASGVRVQAHASELEPLAPAAIQPVPLRNVELAEERSAEAEVDLRGLTVAEAEERLEQALDDALLTGLHELRIIHGKGTGALRKRVDEMLRVSKLVRGHRLGNWNEGGAGVTVADLDT
ncbi:MAG: Smr/MutS family protein [Candidatus Eisenbacteria bacterium]|nr:Smr/MutS family protein [Candidatus Eisenbacteria bacterium]